jgi:hypothetical protein
MRKDQAEKTQDLSVKVGDSLCEGEAEKFPPEDA